jgi:YggT family protein
MMAGIYNPRYKATCSRIFYFEGRSVFDEILAIVLRAVYWVLVPAALLRFYMQAVRAPFRNPIGQFVCAVTDWAVKPLRRILPGRGGYDWASLAAAFLFELLHGLLFDVLTLRMGIFRGAWAAWLVGGVFGFLTGMFTVIMWCVIASAILSWVRVESMVADVLDAIVSPWLKPIRRRLPMVGGFDLSPLVLLILLQIALVMLSHAQVAVAGGLARI